MTEQSSQNEQSQESQPQPPSELEVLKQRAKLMGITHSNNITVETLKAKIEAKMKGEPDPEQPAAPPASVAAAASAQPAQPNALEVGLRQSDPAPVVPEEKPIPTLRQYLMQEQMKLVRCRITNLDPKKKDLPGEIITVANEHLGTVRKFVPYGEATENGYHIPFCIYTMLKNRKFISISTVRDRRTGTERPVNRDVLEFSIEVLDPLTREELEDLRQAQIAAGSVD